MATGRSKKEYEVLNIVSKNGTKYLVRWTDGTQSPVELDDLNCPDLLLQFELKKHSERNFGKSNPIPYDYHLFQTCCCVEWLVHSIRVYSTIIVLYCTRVFPPGLFMVCYISYHVLCIT